MDAEDGAGEVVRLAAVLDVARVEDAVPAVEPAVGAPGQASWAARACRRGRSR